MITPMKYFFSSCLLLLVVTLTHAQVGIGTSNVNTSARLQIDATNKGFLPPRVTLTGTADVSTISTPATGLLVYNTATSGTSPSNVTPGFYYYDGAKWQRIINQQPDATISFNQNTPTSGGVIFTPNIQNSTDYVYVSSTNSSQWTYNGSTYVTFTPPASTPWMLSGGTTDAGSNKSDVVYRTGAVGIGSNTTPNTNSLLDLNSTTKGFLPPRMTSTQRNSLTTPAGLVIYNSTDNRLDVLQNSTWRSLASLDGTEILSNKTLTTPTISSGSDQFPNSFQITPTTHATSRRAAIWIDGWSLLQDVNGNGTKNFSIGQTVIGTPTTYPSRLFISTSGDIGIGNIQPIARLDTRTNPGNANPGEGYLGIGTTSTAANTAGAGALRYDNTGGELEYSNGTAWKPLAVTDAAQTFSGTQTFSNSVVINGASGTGTGLRLTTGASSGKVLTSDVNGNASWETGSVVIYTEVHASAGNGANYADGADFNDFGTVKADNVVQLYGASYGFFNGSGTGSLGDRWVAPRNGKYRITTNAYFNASIYTNPRFYAYKNNTEVCNITSAQSNTTSPDIATSTSAIISMNQGDYINWKVQGGGARIYRGEYHTFFRIESVE